MAADLNPIGLGIGAGADLLKSLLGIYQFAHGNKKLNDLDQPQTSVDPNILQNKLLAGQNASQGFGNQYLNLAGDASDRNLGSTINAGLSSGQGLGFISNAASNSNDAFQSFLMQDAMQKQRNKAALYDANSQLAQENLRVFNWNKALPWEQKFNQFSNQTNSGIENIFGGLNSLGALGAGVAGGNNNNNNNSGGGNGGGGSDGWFQYMLQKYLK